jgi:acyl transferase domain-containing protein/SAM-dependent methyltransferase
MTSPSEPIAIVGMRGRFPGASDLDELWENLAEGVESITSLSADDMRAAGVPEQVFRLPGYVNASPLLGDVDLFDAEFFGFSARDAALTDPQHRLFLETAWEALEDAGYDPAAYPGAIGVFGGCELSSYLYQLHQNIEALGYIDGMQLMVTNDKDHLCTQVSYRLDLRGPSVVVQTTCSTSLVAIGLACESLQARRCDMALAGGVTVRVPQRGGYFYVAGSILSPDGHCRPFDANAQGTIVGSGVGLVVLKRLDDALAAGDSIRAVILGLGINNDGGDKVGYTAPGIRGQQAAITAAYDTAGVSPASVGYVEAHGTGTILGDPIEISALTEVFRAHTDRRGFCGIGSVKSNFGHLSCASGVAGLIKTVLMLEHGAIPPTLHYESPNPAIDLAASPFFVTTELEPWSRNGAPRRAAVSSFGVGGTNAHAILEEAPPPETSPAGRDAVVLTLSARTETALDAATRLLADHIESNPGCDLSDAAYTLHVGRRPFRHRRQLLTDADPATGSTAAALRDLVGSEATAVDGPPNVVFMFPGQGSQYPGMAADLYATEPVVAEQIDACCAILEPELGLDLRRLLFATDRGSEDDAARLRDTALAQPAIFVVEYALSALWRSWGVEPAAMIGHSVGEYVAATIAGVIDLHDALRLLAHRGRLISSLPPGDMIAVMAPHEAIIDLVSDEVALAAVNAPGLCVLSGPAEAIRGAEAELQERSVVARHLHTSHAFHSSMMDPILTEFEETVDQIDLRAPTIPYAATLSGDWADGDVRRPDYWSGQLRRTVQFERGLRALADDPARAGEAAVFLEVGPGRSLGTFASQVSKGCDCSWVTATSLPGPDERVADSRLVLESLGRLWERGVPVDWTELHRGERRRRVRLPTYPFERESYWIGAPNRPTAAVLTEPRDVSGWFYVPTWRPCELPPTEANDLDGAAVLVLHEGGATGDAVVARVRGSGGTALVARRGDRFDQSNADFTLDPADPDGFEQLCTSLGASDVRLAGVIDCWAADAPGATTIEDAATTLFLAPIRLVGALSRLSTVRPLPIVLVARGTDRILDDDLVDPARSFGKGAAKVVPQEHPGFRFCHIDVDDHRTVAEGVVSELLSSAPDPEVALRGGQRHVRTFEPTSLDEPSDVVPLPADPVVLITGGLGHMGLALAESVFESLHAKLVLLGRTAMPAPDRWAVEAERADVSPGERDVLQRLSRLRAGRDEVLVLSADVSDPVQVRAAIDRAYDVFGRIDIVVHGAANVGPGAFGPVAETGPSVVTAQLSPKLTGVAHLVDALVGREPPRFVLHSSISSVLGGLGLAAYSGANAVLDALAVRGGPGWLSIGWDAWDNAAESQMASLPEAIRPAEGQAAFLKILRAGVAPLVLAAVGDLDERYDMWVRRSQLPVARTTGQRHRRPPLSTPYTEARTETERKLVAIWDEQLGIDGVGVMDRFGDLGGHSLLAVQIASEIRDEFRIEMPVLELFKAPTISELAVLVDAAGQTDTVTTNARAAAVPPLDPVDAEDAPSSGVVAPGDAAKASYREFYDDVSRRLAATGMSEASFFLNYGYESLGPGDESVAAVADGVFNAASVRLANELIGSVQIRAREVLDVGCGRGGTVTLLADHDVAEAVGIDLSPQAIAFCRATHRHEHVRFEVGDAENLPFDVDSFDVVTNVESSHTYPDLRAFLREVRRVLRPGGWFLHTDLLPGPRWVEVEMILSSLRLEVRTNREITANVLASCDIVAAARSEAFGAPDLAIDNFLAVPGSPVYEQMASGSWEYRIMRSQRS